MNVSDDRGTEWDLATKAVASGSFTGMQKTIASMNRQKFIDAPAAFKSGSFTGAQYATKKGGYRKTRRNRRSKKASKSRKNRKSKSNRRQ